MYIIADIHVSIFSVFQVISDAAGQGVTITGTKTFNNWNWPNAVIFAATVITTIGTFLFTCDDSSSKESGLYSVQTQTNVVLYVLYERIREYCPKNLRRTCILHYLRALWGAFMSYLDQ